MDNRQITCRRGPPKRDVTVDIVVVVVVVVVVDIIKYVEILMLILSSKRIQVYLALFWSFNSTFDTIIIVVVVVVVIALPNNFKGMIPK